MKMKRAICVILAAAMCFCILPFGASAKTGKYYSASAGIINGVKLYPQKTGFINIDQIVGTLLSQLRPKCKTTADLVQASYDWLVDNLSYKLGTYYPYYDYSSRSEIPIPFYVLYFSYCPFAEKTGVCDNFSTAYMIILRAIGIDAYIRTGKMYSSGTTYDHVWVEALMNGKYYIFDPQVENRVKGSRGTNTHSYYCMPADENRSTYSPNWTLTNAYQAATLPVNQTKNAYCFATLRSGGNGSVSGNYQTGKSVQMAARTQHFSKKNYGYKFDGWLADTGCCRRGASVTVTAKPASGAKFLGWYVNDSLKSKSTTYTFTVTGDSKIVALFSGRHYADVPSGSWYYDAAYYCYDNSLMSGTGIIDFSPNATLTRAMVVTILSKMSGDSMSAFKAGTSFPDVKANTYCALPVEWAFKNGIAAGVGYGFAPNAPVTREQLAMFLYKYAIYKKMNTFSRSNLGAYKDSANVSSWATDAFSWAVSKSLISGFEDKTLGPKKNATRAQAAVIFMKFDKMK